MAREVMSEKGRLAVALGAASCALCGNPVPPDGSDFAKFCGTCRRAGKVQVRFFSKEAFMETNEKGSLAAALGAPCCKTCGEPLRTRVYKEIAINEATRKTVVARFCPNCSMHKPPDHPSDCFCAECLR